MAENATHTLHNLLTLRGAVVRDPHAWAGYLTEAIERFGGDVDVVFASHHWPTWGADRIVEFLSMQRDLYAYLHDQTLRLMNQGHTGIEIAELIELPPALEAAWSTHGYYGSVSHNVKAIYQRYMGWYDGNPARLWQHTPGRGRQAVRRLHGRRRRGRREGAGLVRSRRPAAGRRRCSTTWSSRSPTTRRRRRCSPTCSNSSASAARTARGAARTCPAAMELRGAPSARRRVAASADIIGQLSPDLFFDARRRSRSNGPKAWDLDLATRWVFPDPDGATYRVTLKNGVLSHVRDGHGDATLTVTVPQAALGALAAGDVEARDWARDSRSTATRARCSRCSACSTRATPASTS